MDESGELHDCPTCGMGWPSPVRRWCRCCVLEFCCLVVMGLMLASAPVIAYPQGAPLS